MNPFRSKTPPRSLSDARQILFHIQEPGCNGYDFHYHLQEQTEYVIGRVGSDPVAHSGIRIDLQDHLVSRNHCRLFPHAKGFWMIEDLGSTNGTFLKAPDAWIQVTEITPIPAKIVIRVGQTLLAVTPLDEKAQSHARWTWKRLAQQVA
ncbi:MAG: FHA domain-containing protein [Magnetococcales bacterium]|nr:FHA domain-containing protein [Magnetococcales bacterium]